MQWLLGEVWGRRSDWRGGTERSKVITPCINFWAKRADKYGMRETGNVASYIGDCLSRRLIFFTGKGGVGKSTIAWATAIACQRRGAKVTVASWDAIPSDSDSPPSQIKGIDWLPLETGSAFRAYAMKILRFAKVYDAIFDNQVLRTFVYATPGLSAAVIAAQIQRTVAKGDQDLLVVDLPSSGHALSFFKSPLGLKTLFPLGFIRRDLDRICELLSSNDTRVDLVAAPEELPITEGVELHDSLKRLHPLHFGYFHVNQCTPFVTGVASEDIAKLPAEIREVHSRYQWSVSQESEAIRSAAALHLPTVELPKVTQEGKLDIIYEIADRLEQVE